MVAWDLLECWRRHPWLAVLGVLTTVIVAAFIARSPGVYAASTTVTLQLPGPSEPNPLDVQPKSLIDMAGVVASILGSDSVRFSSQAVPLSGTGVLDGFSVRQQDSGRQWNEAFERPEIRIQVTGPSPELVALRVSRLLDDVDAALWRLQAEHGVARVHAIVARRDSEIPAVVYEHGSPARAVVSVIALGVGITSVVMLMLDRVTKARRQSIQRGEVPDRVRR